MGDVWQLPRKSNDVIADRGVAQRFDTIVGEQLGGDADPGSRRLRPCNVQTSGTGNCKGRMLRFPG